MEKIRKKATILYKKLYCNCQVRLSKIMYSAWYIYLQWYQSCLQILLCSRPCMFEGWTKRSSPWTGPSMIYCALLTTLLRAGSSTTMEITLDLLWETLSKTSSPSFHAAHCTSSSVSDIYLVSEMDVVYQAERQCWLRYSMSAFGVLTAIPVAATAKWKKIRISKWLVSTKNSYWLPLKQVTKVTVQFIAR
jgi:hypothetical protein